MQLFKNNARAALAAGIAAGDTTLTVEAPKADLFPIANTGTGALPAVATDWFKAVLEDSSGNVEIVYVRTRTSGSAVFSNVLRGQEGTTARAYAAGSVVGLRMTALDVQTALGVTGQVNTFTSQQTFAAGVKFTNWTITETGGVLYFATGGVNKMKIDAAGNLTVAGTVYLNGVV